MTLKIVLTLISTLNIYIFGLNEQTNIDNGSIYYYLISIVLTFYDGSYQGNNYLIILNNAVQSLNFVISLIGLLGYYLFFKRDIRKIRFLFP